MKTKEFGANLKKALDFARALDKKKVRSYKLHSKVIREHSKRPWVVHWSVSYKRKKK